MAKKRKGVLIPGVDVYVKRRNYPSEELIIDKRYKYRIRSIGKKRCILDWVGDDGEVRIGSRGRSYDIYSEEEARLNSERGWSSFCPTKWSHLLVPAGNDGWDPIENY